MLKMTEIKLYLSLDVDMHQCIEKLMRRKVSYITQRCSKGDNEYKGMLWLR